MRSTPNLFRGVALAALTLAACRPAARPIRPGPQSPPVARTLPEALPNLPTVPLAAPVASAPDSARRITITAVDADARSLLIAIAREAGISMVVSSDVRRRVSVSLTNASADAAIAAIIAQAGLLVARAPQPTPAVVYYQLPVNVNEAPAETISARFGVGTELSTWIIENRPPKPPQP